MQVKSHGQSLSHIYQTEPAPSRPMRIQSCINVSFSPVCNILYYPAPARCVSLPLSAQSPRRPPRLAPSTRTPICSPLSSRPAPQTLSLLLLLLTSCVRVSRVTQSMVLVLGVEEQVALLHTDWKRPSLRQ